MTRYAIVFHLSEITFSIHKIGALVSLSVGSRGRVSTPGRTREPLCFQSKERIEGRGRGIGVVIDRGGIGAHRT